MAMCSFADRFSMFDVTPVENLFIEEYMLRAPGDYVKVYIYGLRLCYHPVKEASVTSIARALGLEEKTVMDAFAYWERVGVLRRTGVIDALEAAGVQEGDTVSLYDIEFDFVN